MDLHVQSIQKPDSDERAPYQPPAIVYEGVIGVRAGTPIAGRGPVPGTDPGDLFGNQ